jgi:cell division protein FtsB
MGVMRAIQHQAKAMAAPCAFLLLAGYFVWHASQGERGWRSYALRLDQLRAAQQELARVQDEEQGWERRVGALRNGRLDRDLLDERARVRLDLADPADVVVLYPPGKHLF